MSGVVGPNVDRNDDRKGLLIPGQESLGTFCSVKSGTVVRPNQGLLYAKQRSPDFASGRRRSIRTEAPKTRGIAELPQLGLLYWLRMSSCCMCWRRSLAGRS